MCQYIHIIKNIDSNKVQIIIVKKSTLKFFDKVDTEVKKLVNPKRNFTRHNIKCKS